MVQWGGGRNTFLITQKLPVVPAKSTSTLSLPEVSVRAAVRILLASYGAVYEQGPQAQVPCVQVLSQHYACAIPLQLLYGF